MEYILFDGNTHNRLLPFTFTRPVADIRIGILTIREKWEGFLGAACSCLTADYLQEKFPFTPRKKNILINASILPDKELAGEIHVLKAGESLVKEGRLLAVCLEEKETLQFASSGQLTSPGLIARTGNFMSSGHFKQSEWTSPVLQINFPEDIFRLNAEALAADFRLLTQDRTSAEISPTNRIKGRQLFVEDGVEMECANINTETGPVYIGRGAVVMEGLNLRGPAAICEHAVVKMGAKIYGPTTIGPKSVVGGEIKQSVIFGHTNKSHEGYLGNSVVGEWCNFGADTNCSNMKNNYRPVKLWSYETGCMRDTGLSYCGLMMGDFSRTGINSMLNTGTTVGVNANLFGGGFLPVFVPDFSWADGNSLQTYHLEKALETAALIKKQKGDSFTEKDALITAEVFNRTSAYRDPAASGQE